MGFREGLGGADGMGFRGSQEGSIEGYRQIFVW